MFLFSTSYLIPSLESLGETGAPTDVPDIEFAFADSSSIG